MCVVLTVGYVLLLRLTSAVVSPNDGEAALVELDGKVVGAANVGQAFTDSVYFWGRPSAVEYNGGGSGGSNKGTNNPEYLSEVESRIESFMAAHPYLSRGDVPSELVTASGSGLDPDISVRGAEVQIRRVAASRGMGNVERDAVLQDNQKTYLWGGRSSEDRQDIYHASSCCKKEKEKKEIIKGQSRKIKFLALFD